MDSEFVVGVDAGTTKVAVVVGELLEGGAIKIVGVGTRESAGLRKGVVVNIEEAASCVAMAVREAERMAGVEIRGATVCLSSPDIKSFNSRGVVAITPGAREITGKDVDHVLSIARDVTLPGDREIVQTVPQDYLVDAHGGIKDPVGMSAERLGAELHIVTGLSMTLDNITKVLRKANLEIVSAVFEPIASARAVCTAEETEAGCLVIDMGGGVTSYAIYRGGFVEKSGVVPVGGGNITNDLVIGLRLPFAAAETVKRTSGVALVSLVGADEVVVLPPSGERSGETVGAQVIAAIVEPRCEEIFSMVKEAAGADRALPMLGGGVILTGGASQIRGMEGVAGQVFDLPARFGKPGAIEGLAECVGDPASSAVVGLLIHERDQIARESERGAGVLERLKSIAGRLRNVASWS
jgi:cell division protein FtsA